MICNSVKNEELSFVPCLKHRMTKNEPSQKIIGIDEKEKDCLIIKTNKLNPFKVLEDKKRKVVVLENSMI